MFILHPPEVRAAGGQHHFMAGELTLLHQQSDVSQQFLLVEKL